jgi:hypothetical protein
MSGTAARETTKAAVKAEVKHVSKKALVKAICAKFSTKLYQL